MEPPADTALAPLSGDDSAAIRHATDHAIAYRESLADGRVTPALRPAEISARFATPLPPHGQDAATVIRDLVEQAAGGIHGHGSPRFFGYVCGGSMPVGVAADILVSAWGQNAASSWESPSVAVIEQTLCRWCLDLLALPAGCGVGLVTGATVANTQGIIAARDALLARQGWDIAAQGLFGAPEIPVLIGADAHSAPLAGLKYAGFGLDRAVRVATDDQGRMQIDAVRTALAACNAPPLVVLQAGQINTGAFDPFAEIMPLVREMRGWVHVDGAFGLWLHAVPGLRHRLAGVADADSWAVDLHKWLNAPYDAGLCILRERAALVSAMSARGAYLPDTGETWEPSDSTLELSRRARGVPSYAILKHLGVSGLQEMISRHCALATYLAERLTDEPGLAVVNDVVANQVAIRCDTDELTRKVLQQVQTSGRVYPSHGVWRGRQIIRVSISNHATSRADIDLLVNELRSAFQLVQRGNV